MRRIIPRINIIICGACLILLLADRLLPEILLFNDKPAKIIALIACLSAFLTAVICIAENRRRARRRTARRRSRG